MGDYNFDRVSEQYDETRGLPPGVAEGIAQWVLARLPQNPAVTELGVGTGRIAIPFIEAGVRYAGFDISEQMLSRLREKLGHDLRQSHIFQHDIHAPLPLPEASQDAVVAVNILHLVDAAKALTNARRVLKPHGVLVWGYEERYGHDPVRQTRDRFFEEARTLGFHRKDQNAQAGRALLTRWAALVTQHVVATWTEEASLQTILDQLRAKVFSSTWGMSDEQVSVAADRAETWARAEFGDLHIPRPSEHRFVVDWYVLGGL